MGAFIVLEGLDRSGKSTQVERLVKTLVAAGHPAKAVRFPDRTTTIGKMIDSYLQNKSELDDRAIHLLFSANRWERAAAIRQDLDSGTTVIADRYAFSGIAFSAAKGLDYAWCKAPDVGLLKPDRVFFLDLSADAAEKRGGYGQERYEQKALQEKVRGLFAQIGKDYGEGWTVIDADRTPDQVADQLGQLAIEAVSKPDQAQGLWQ